MDLPTDYRAAANVAPVSAGEPDLPVAGGQRGAPRPPGSDVPALAGPRRWLAGDSRALATRALLGAAAIALILALRDHAHGFGAIPAVLRTAAAGCVLFGLV